MNLCLSLQEMINDKKKEVNDNLKLKKKFFLNQHIRGQVNILLFKTNRMRTNEFQLFC